MELLPVTRPESGRPFAHEPRMLVVDDLESNRRILTRLLRRRGVDVIEAESGAAALDAIRRAPPRNQRLAHLQRRVEDDL